MKALVKRIFTSRYNLLVLALVQTLTFVLGKKEIYFRESYFGFIYIVAHIGVLAVGLFFIFHIGSIIAYFVCFFFVNKRAAASFVALMLFVIDTFAFTAVVILFGFEAIDIVLILEIAFHIWMMIYLICDVREWIKI